MSPTMRVLLPAGSLITYSPMCLRNIAAPILQRPGTASAAPLQGAMMKLSSDGSLAVKKNAYMHEKDGH